MNRTRKRHVPGLFEQAGKWRYLFWRDPTTNNGLNPVLYDSKGPGFPVWGGQDLPMSQVTVDENHGLRGGKYAQYLSEQFRGDVGGEFWSQKKWAQLDVANSHTLTGQGFAPGYWVKESYHGPILATTVNASMYPTYNERDLIPLGTTAIARCKPTNNVASLAVSIAETFNDGLPKLFGASSWEDRTNVAKGAGGEYLNSEFGWKPLVSDIRNASYGIANAHRLISAYEHNSGRLVRRRYEFPVERTLQTTVIGPSDAVGFSGFAGGNMIDLSKSMPVLVKTSRFYRRTWFSGGFTYHLPTGYKSRNWLVRNAAQAGPLLGIELTPETVWAATPWTWAAGWFSNMGDLVNNLSDWSTDGLVLKYGYIMEHTIQMNTYTLQGPTRFKPYGTIYASPVTVCVETKRRVKATPFGFGLNWNTFSPRQLAIAAALGITRVF